MCRRVRCGGRWQWTDPAPAPYRRCSAVGTSPVPLCVLGSSVCYGSVSVRSEVAGLVGKQRRSRPRPATRNNSYVRRPEMAMRCPSPSQKQDGPQSAEKKRYPVSSLWQVPRRDYTSGVPVCWFSRLCAAGVQLGCNGANREPTASLRAAPVLITV